jgi:hypothetical protein
MKTTATTLLLLLGLIFSPLSAAVPAYLNYQGFLTNSSGTPIGESAAEARTVRFRLFDAATGGSHLWEFTTTVTFLHGQFSVLLGGNDFEKKFANITTSQERYLEITVGGSTNPLNAADHPVQPRQRLTATAYAFHAISAETAESVGTGTTLQIGSQDNGLGYYDATRHFSGAAVNGPVLFGTGGGALGTKVGSTESMVLRWTQAGNVGIGVGDPTVKLDVGGALKTSGDASIGGKLTVSNGNLVGGPANGVAGGDGQRLVLKAGDAANPPMGFGVTAGELYSVAPGSAKFRWFGGQTQRMELDAATGNLETTGTFHADGSISSGGAITSSGAITATGDVISSGKLSVDQNARFNGHVGIGLPANDQPTYPLHVRSINATGTFWTLAYLNHAGASNADQTASNFSIKADGNIAADVFFATSDARMKRVVGLSDAQADLQRLLQVKVTDYRFIDTARFHSGMQKKVIAQELEQVYPEAVTRGTDVVPDIFKKAVITNGWVALETNLKAGERVRLVTQKQNTVHEVLDVQPGRFLISAHPVGQQDVFVYGREVKDFRSVDYEALTTLNVSATQQLKKEKDAQVAALQAENAQLAEKLAAQEKRLQALEAADEARDAKLAALERLLEGSTKPRALPVSLQKGTGAE